MPSEHPVASEHPIAAEFSRAELRGQGLTDHQLHRLLRTGRLIPVRRGVLSPVAPGAVEAVRAVLLTHRRELVVSHLSAAQLLGLPRPLSGWHRPELTGESGATRNGPDLRICVAPLASSQVDQHLGMAVTSPARTVVDCARTLPPRDGLAIADAALHLGLVREEELMAILASQAGWPGIVAARSVLRLADGRRESPLESWSAWAFDQSGVPEPEWQVTIRTVRGQFLGRCDAWWSGVAGEADGRSKYRLAAAERGGADAATLFDVLTAERAREQGVRGTGAEVVRWETAEVLRPDRATTLASRIRRTLARAEGGRHFTGRAASEHSHSRAVRDPPERPPRVTDSP